MTLDLAELKRIADAAQNTLEIAGSFLSGMTELDGSEATLSLLNSVRRTAKELRAVSAGLDALTAQRDAQAARIEALEAGLKEACDLLAERTHGSPARSPGHNARLRLERALGDRHE